MSDIKETKIAKDWLESLEDGEGEYYLEHADVKFFKKIISTWLKNNGVVAGIYSVVINGTEFVPINKGEKNNE